MTIYLDFTKKLNSGKRCFDLQVKLASEDRWTVLFGPSGSGKTLTLKALAGLLTPDSGRISFRDHIWFDGAKRANCPVRRRRVGYLFQDYALFPHLSVAANIGFGLHPNRPWRFCSSAKNQVNDFLKMFDLEALADCYPRDLSGGQRQRVALARSLIGKPGLLLLDEPFAALDPMLRHRLRAELQALLNQFDIPVVMISHDPADIEQFAQTLVIYRNGRVHDTLTDYQQKKINLRWYYDRPKSQCNTQCRGCQDTQCTIQRSGCADSPASGAARHRG